LPDFFPLRGCRLAVALRDVGQHQIPHALRILRGKGGGHQRAQRMADQYGLLTPARSSIRASASA
jgi:hypothetical protein